MWCWRDRPKRPKLANYTSQPVCTCYHLYRSCDAAWQGLNSLISVRKWNLLLFWSCPCWISKSWFSAVVLTYSFYYWVVSKCRSKYQCVLAFFQLTPGKNNLVVNESLNRSDKSRVGFVGLGLRRAFNFRCWSNDWFRVEVFHGDTAKTSKALQP